jgi:hypothetical protein
MVNLEQFKKSGVCAIYHRVPIEYLEEFRSEMAKQNKFFKIRFRGPRFNTPSARYRGCNSKQSTCLKEDAIAFSVYRY